jgi:hypothetical protein
MLGCSQAPRVMRASVHSPCVRGRVDSLRLRVEEPKEVSLDLQAFDDRLHHQIRFFNRLGPVPVSAVKQS